MATVSLSVPIRGELADHAGRRKPRGARVASGIEQSERPRRVSGRRVEGHGPVRGREDASRAVGCPEPAPLERRSKPHGAPDERPRDFPLTSSNPKSRRPGTAREASATRRLLEGVFAAYAPEPRR